MKMLMIFLMLSMMGAMAIDTLSSHESASVKVLKRLETTAAPLYYYD